MIAFLAIISMASATNYDFVRQVPNDGPTNFVGYNGILPPDDPGVTWTPLQVGDTFQKTNDLGQIFLIPVGAKLPPRTISPINRLFSNSRGANNILIYDRMMKRTSSLGSTSGISHTMG